jgi:outer membrane protein assembly factor BamB
MNKKVIIFGISLIFLLIAITTISASSVLVDLTNLSKIGYGHELIWRANVTGFYDEQAIASYANDTVFVNSRRDNKFYGVNATNGTILWDFYVGTAGAGYTGFGGPTYYGGVVYNAFNGIYAVHPNNGTSIWNYTDVSVEFSQNVAVDEDYVAAVSYIDPSSVFVLNRTTGEVVWNSTVGSAANRIAAEPLLYEDYLIIASFNADTYGLVAFNVTNGSIIWNRTDNAFWDGAPVLYGDKIYITYNYGISSRYLINGTTFLDDTGVAGRTSTVSIHDDVAFSSINGNFYASYLNGTVKWNSYDTYGGTYGSDQTYAQSSISNGLVFSTVMCDSCTGETEGDGFIYAINETNGDFLWRYHVPEDIFGYVSIAAGNIYVVTDEDYLYAFDFGIGSGDYPLIGYDSNRTGYSPDGISTWQYVQVNCTENAPRNHTCNITNNYDHEVHNLTLNFTNLNFKYDVYNSTGDLTNSSVSNYTFSSLSSFGSEIITIVQKEEILQCTQIISAGSYVIPNDLSTSSTCINIDTDNVIIDCQWNTISGGGAGYAFDLDASSSDYLSNITIKNCYTNNFLYAFRSDYTNESYFYNLTLNSPSGYGLYLGTATRYNYFENITIIANSAMLVTGSDYNNFSRLNLTGGSGTLIKFDSGSDNNKFNESSFTGGLYHMEILNTGCKDNYFYDSNFSGATNYSLRFTVSPTPSYRNYFYNNIFNNTNNTYFASVNANNEWNTTFDSGTTNIIGELAYGGNYWATPNGNGYSETCTDSNSNGVCDSPYDVESNGSCTEGVDCTTQNIDYYPLTIIIPNSVPFINLTGLNLMTMNEDTTNATINLSYHVSDPEDDDVLINWTCSDNETDFTVSVNNESKLMNLTAGNNFHGLVNVTCTAHDTSSGTNSSWFLVTVTNVADSSIVTLLSPQSGIGYYDPTNITFIYNVSDSGVNIENCSLILNGYLNYTNISITEDINQTLGLNNLGIGNYSWSVNCTNADGEVYASSANLFSVFNFSFTSNSTNLTLTNTSNIADFAIDNYPYGRINFTNIDVSSELYINENVNISQNYIYLNSTNLTGLNTSARITLFNLSFTNPRPLKDGVFCSDCTEVSYSGGIFVFDVPSFSNYSAEETPDEGGDGGTTSSSGGGGTTTSSETNESENTTNSTSSNSGSVAAITGEATSGGNGESGDSKNVGEIFSSRFDSVLDEVYNLMKRNEWYDKFLKMVFFNKDLINFWISNAFSSDL